MRLRARWSTIVPVVTAVLVLCAALPASGVEARPSQRARVRLSADMDCLPRGGAGVTFTIGNAGRTTVALDGDFHLELTKVTAYGPEGVGIVFVFPIPELSVIAPGKASTFLVDIGAPFEGEPGVDLTARRLVLEAEVFIEGRKHPVRRFLGFPGCNA
jgi:hypothetical protein